MSLKLCSNLFFKKLFFKNLISQCKLYFFFLIGGKHALTKGKKEKKIQKRFTSTQRACSFIRVSNKNLRCWEICRYDMVAWFPWHLQMSCMNSKFKSLELSQMAFVTLRFLTQLTFGNTPPKRKTQEFHVGGSFRRNYKFSSHPKYC